MRKFHVLVIEQDETNRTTVATALAEAGYDVTEARDALQGLQSILASYPDIIIMNSRLSDASGNDARTRIREASYLPILVLGNQQDAVESLEIGADAFMTTPPKPRELVSRVRSLLNRKTRLTEDR